MRRLALLLMAGCIENAPAPEVYDLDPAYHRCRVQPIIDEKCSMLACHGDVRRPLHTFTRNRLRMVGTNIQRNLPLSAEELEANYDSARAFAAADPNESWLLLKALDEGAGGYYHRGRQIFAGPDVFETPEDPDYRTLLSWLSGETEDPSCKYPGTEEP